ncbi:DUF1904 domain-containing protein [Desulfosporosinus youngiae]|uniref:DUF1904 domain-containing protein n=1 Tax=Desulfosporosinus youngiae DSM 17734 TaxID=768710 RepID=H5XX06_9FIRM|nr:DUF1904 domain-containing protein [Desulfosporosinus youngiae]EHQ90874.1 protein of unknown function (DUF1904) [Desulfosporosinus youngiae DSM 17734]
MPQIKIRGIGTNTILKLSSQLIDELALLTNSPKDDFTLEVINSTFIQNGEIVSGYPFVEVAWFDRGQEAQDQVAKTISRLINQAGCPSVDIMFTILEKPRYYENGEHY